VRSQSCAGMSQERAAPPSVIGLAGLPVLSTLGAKPARHPMPSLQTAAAAAGRVWHNEDGMAARRYGPAALHRTGRRESRGDDGSHAPARPNVPWRRTRGDAETCLRVNHHRGTSRVRSTLRHHGSGCCSMGESDDVASGRRNGEASPLLVGAWSLVADGAVKSGAKATLTA
jgi:hypothetical protein